MLRHALGILQEQPGYDMGTSEKYRGNTIFDNTLGIIVVMVVHSGGTMGILWECCVNSLAIPWEYSGSTVEILC